MVIVIALGVIVVFAIIVAALSYLKAPPNMAYVVSGLRKEPRYIIGSNGFRIPFLERLDKLYLGVIGVDVKTREAVPTSEYIDVFVDANVNIKVGSSPKLMALAAKNFLNQKSDVIAAKALPVLEGNVREIIGQMPLTDLVSNRQAFAAKVLENVLPDMNELGLEVVSFNVQNFSDPNGVINNLGVDNTEQIKKKAAIAKSDALREVAEREAENQRKANEAQVEAATKIAEQNTALDIRSAELKTASEVQRAAADMSYDIQKADQQKALEVAQTNARIAQTEREVELKARQIELKERELDAIVRKEADAQLYKTQKEAEAALIVRQKKAEAEAYEAIQRAEAAKRTAELEAEARRVTAEAQLVQAQKEAEGIAAKHNAEAEGIRAKGLAEAEGIDKKAEAQKKFGEASVLEMYFKAMPEIMAAASAPLTGIDNLTMYGDGNTTKLVNEVTTNVSQVMEAMKANGIDITALLSGALGGKLAAQ